MSRSLFSFVGDKTVSSGLAGSPESQPAISEESTREHVLERNLRKIEERYLIIPGKGRILKQEYRDEGDDQLQNWKSIMKQAQGESETPSPNITPTKELRYLKSDNENKENPNKDLLHEGTWNDRMNKFLFLQNFAQLLEKHGFKCDDPNFMENNEFVQSILQFFQKSGVVFPENTGRIFIEEETEEVSDQDFNY